jgi:hypothetical protein
VANLLSSAFKYTAAGGLVILRAAEDPTLVDPSRFDLERDEDWNASRPAVPGSHREFLSPARWPLFRAKPKNANTVRLLTILRVNKNVQPCVFDQDVGILHEPYRLTVIAHQNEALRWPFGVTYAGAAAQTLFDTGFLPWRDVGPPAAFVADPPTQRSGLRADRGDAHDDYCEHDTDLSLHGETSRHPDRKLEPDSFTIAQRRPRARSEPTATER